MPEEVRRVGAKRQLRARDHLRRVPILREVLRRHLQVQLHARASGFGRDGRGLQAESFGTRDVDLDVLSAGVEDRIVEGLVAGGLAHPVAGQVFRHQRRQDADHHDVRAARIRLRLGRVEAGAHLGFQLQCRASRQRPGWNVEFDVVGAQFRLVRRIRDGGQHFGIAHRGLVAGVDEVAFDLHAGQRTLELEAGPGQHRLEHVEAQLDLASILAAVRATEVGLLHFFAHKAMQQAQ